MSISSVIGNCPVPMSAHLVQGHVKKDNKAFLEEKSYFTDSTGAEIGWEPAIHLLIKAKDTIGTLTRGKASEGKTITVGMSTVHAISADPGKLGFAVTWNEKVGSDNRNNECKWICFFVTQTLTSGRHQWVTSFPATQRYVDGKKGVASL